MANEAIIDELLKGKLVRLAVRSRIDDEMTGLENGLRFLRDKLLQVHFNRIMQPDNSWLLELELRLIKPADGMPLVVQKALSSEKLMFELKPES